MNTGKTEPAFPQPARTHGMIPSQTGMSLRDYFAASMVQSGAVFKVGSFPATTMQDVAKQAYQLADAMLEARK